MGAKPAEAIEAGPEIIRGAAGSQDLSDRIVQTLYQEAELIAEKVVSKKAAGVDWDRRLDDILTSRLWGYPLMLLLLGLIFWITISGANYPSELLTRAFFTLERYLGQALLWLGLPDWLYGFLLLGVYRSLAWVVAVMLPPMAIFFPLFTILEDLGYLPRAAYNMDNLFYRAGACGKQALTMCMGFGCNAAGVISCRIIESPRERLIAVLTNNFVPCNGRFPLLITVAVIISGGMVLKAGSITAAAAVLASVLIGVAATLMVSYFLSRTFLQGMPSFYTLEMPPYRKPALGQIIVRSIMDRTLFVLSRAVIVAAPAGGLIWILANISYGDTSLYGCLAAILDPCGHFLGMDGIILMAFILGLPANELVIPLLIMGYMATGSLEDIHSLAALKNLLVDQHGWTYITGICTMLFSLLHYPCGTTLLTIYRETGSFKWTLMAFMLPLITALMVCGAVAQFLYLF
jgi:ferrous iron transport protein B